MSKINLIISFIENYGTIVSLGIYMVIPIAKLLHTMKNQQKSFMFHFKNKYFECKYNMKEE